MTQPRSCDEPSGCGRDLRLPEAEHQTIGPVEERRRVDHIDDGGVIQANRAQARDMCCAEASRAPIAVRAAALNVKVVPGAFSRASAGLG